MEEMIMTVREKYEPALKQLQEDAIKRQEAANQKLNEKQQKYLDCEQNIADLRTTAINMRAKFREIGKALVTMYVKRTETPEEVEKLIEPCNTYVTVASAIPIAEEALKNANNEKVQAGKELQEEISLLSAVNLVLKQLPDKE